MVAARVGQTCVFREKILVYPGIVTAAAGDEWGVVVAVRPIRERGFIYPRVDQVDLTAAWGWGSFGTEEWSGGQGAAWCIYFDDDLLRCLRRIASEASESGRMARWERLTAEIDRMKSDR